MRLPDNHGSGGRSERAQALAYRHLVIIASLQLAAGLFGTASFAVWVAMAEKPPLWMSLGMAAICWLDVWVFEQGRQRLWFLMMQRRQW